jgi:hypothetical protein
MTKLGILLLTILVLLSPGFRQLPQILKQESLKPNPVWQVSVFEVADINTIRGWHESSFEKMVAKIAWNKPAMALDKFVKNSSLLLDPNFYFFGEHPRERLEPKAREKLPVIYLPLLLLGLWRVKKWFIIFLTSVLIFALLGLTNNLVGLVLSALLLYPIFKYVQK